MQDRQREPPAFRCSCSMWAVSANGTQRTTCEQLAVIRAYRRIRATGGGTGKAGHHTQILQFGALIVTNRISVGYMRTGSVAATVTPSPARDAWVVRAIREGHCVARAVC